MAMPDLHKRHMKMLSKLLVLFCPALALITTVTDAAQSPWKMLIFLLKITES